MSASLSSRIFPLALAVSFPALSTAQVAPAPDAGPALASADAPLRLDPVEVIGRSTDLTGRATTASEGFVGAIDLAARPFLRRGELLEVVPGLVVTQHSGGGKANQYFLRGFNLDHGTDFALSVDGVPVNQRTHGHGQGYADMNFVIPELVAAVAYNKGPFYAEVGDFSAAGAADVTLVSTLTESFVALSAGADDHLRAVAAGSITLRDNTRTGTTSSAGTASTATLTTALEVSSYDGPFELPENFHRTNALARYHAAGARGFFTATALFYRATWDSTDQIPLRAIRDGRLDRLGHVDPTDGGETRRIALTLEGGRTHADGATRAGLYVVDYDFQLFSNFGYFLDDPVAGDQFEQLDDRVTYGGHLTREWRGTWLSTADTLTAGLQARFDDIGEVGLHRAEARRRLSTVRSDAVRESSLGLYLQHTAAWTDRLRTVTGLRADGYHFDVTSDLAANSGDTDDAIVSPKLSIIWQARPHTELYASGGFGFHSNDARGTTITVDPVSGDAAERVDPLVRSRSVEAGLRTSAVTGLVSTLAVFVLDLDSELLFVGDAGGTEASGATQRVGMEWSNHYNPTSWLALDADVTLTRPRFRDAPGADRIPGAIERSLSAGVVLGSEEGWRWALRARHFGPRVLTEDGTVRGRESWQFQTRLAWRRGPWEIAGEVLNLFDRDDHDIEYFYASRLPGEPAEGIEDIHLHPIEPRTWRLTLTRRF